MRFALILTSLIFLSCDSEAYQLDYKDVEVTEMSDYVPSFNIAAGNIKRTEKDSISFITDAETYSKGETIFATIENNSQSNYLLTDEHAEFDFDRSQVWVSYSTVNDYYKVSESPDIAGKITKIQNCHFVQIQFIPSEEEDGLFEPGEKINFEIVLPELTGKFQLELYCVTQKKISTWGLNNGSWPSSNTFMVE